MDDDNGIPECDDCGDDRGMCDNPHLQNGRCFSHTLKEGFKDFTVCDRGGVSRSFDEMITIDLVESTLTIRLQTCNDIAP